MTRINWGSKPTTVKKMAEELEHADNAARETAIETIAGQGLAAIELLRELIQHPKMKYIAIQALKKIKGEQAAEILIDYILGESNYYDRKLAAEALIQLGYVSVKPTISSIKKAAPDALQASYDTIMLILGELHDQTMIELVIHLLKNKPAFPEAKAIESISKFKKMIVNPLLEILDDPRCKREVIYILGKIGDARALESLMNILPGDAENRLLVINALGRIRDPRAIDSIMPFLKDNNFLLRAAVCWSLGNIRDPRTVDALIEMLKDTEQEVRVNAVEALRKIKTTRVIEPLKALLKDKFKNVRKKAAEALSELDKDHSVAVLQLGLKDRSKKNRIKAVKDLSKKQGEESINAICAAIKDKDPKVRNEAAVALGGLKAPASAPYLFAALQDDSIQVKHNALIALEAIYQEVGISAFDFIPLNEQAHKKQGLASTDLLPILYAALDVAEDKETRLSEAFSRARAITEIQLIAQNLKSDYSKDWKDALITLGERHHPLSVKYLIETLQSSDQDIRYYAARSLSKMELPSITPLLFELRRSMDINWKKIHRELESAEVRHSIANLFAKSLFAKDQTERENACSVLDALMAFAKEQ